MAQQSISNRDSIDYRDQLLVQAVNSIQDYAIFMLDPDGKILSWNEGAKRIKGYSEKEILGQHFSIFYTPEDLKRDHPEEELKIVRETGKFEEEGWRVRKDGQRFWASVLITALRDQQGKILGFSKVTRDLTERRMMEALTVAKKDLERALASRDEFLSIASHELKTPITSLKLQAQLLDAKIDPDQAMLPPLPKLKNGIQLILRQTDRLTSLIEYMLDVSRAHLGKFTFKFERVDLSKLVKDVFAQWEEPFKAAQTERTAEIESGIVIQVDRYRIEQVLSNLLSNVLKYAGGKPMNLRLKKEKTFAVIEIQDRGPGIDPSKLGRIFERYERAVDNQEASGLGLGLFISKAIVEAHGGKIQVESELNVGSTFRVTLPLDLNRIIASQ